MESLVWSLGHTSQARGDSCVIGSLSVVRRIIMNLIPMPILSHTVRSALLTMISNMSGLFTTSLFVHGYNIAMLCVIPNLHGRKRWTNGYNFVVMDVTCKIKCCVFRQCC